MLSTQEALRAIPSSARNQTWCFRSVTIFCPKQQLTITLRVRKLDGIGSAAASVEPPPLDPRPPASPTWEGAGPAPPEAGSVSSLLPIGDSLLVGGIYRHRLF